MLQPITLAPVIDFGRDLCSNLSVSGRREWLVTNGIGGFAAGTMAGILTRHYHGLLIAALKPPLGRTLLATKLDETAYYDEYAYPLFANQWGGGAVDPSGFQHLDHFYLEGAIPVWEYTFADALLEKRIWMQQGENSTYVRYHLRRAARPMRLVCKALVNYRDYHSGTHGGDWRMQIEPVAQGLQVTAYQGATPFYLLSSQAQATPRHEWYRNFALSIEAYRGLDSQEDHIYAGEFDILLQPGETVTIVASTNGAANLDGDAMLQAQRARERVLVAHISSGADPANAERGHEANRAVDLAKEQAAIAQLHLAADQFIVKRPSPSDANGHSVIAGYPWFGDWGRDTMIALAGLTLTTGRPAIAASILRTFAQFVDQGMLPNRFPDAGETPEYNTVDATLWYFEAIRAYLAATDDTKLLRDLFPVLQEVIDWHLRGTRYNIRVQSNDGLLYAGEAGVQLTWMDAKVGDWVVTPRIGKPVEINALWYNALRSMADFARRLRTSPSPYEKLAEQCVSGFQRFWSAERGYCFDVLDVPTGGDDASLRPNQIFAVSLPYSPLNPQQQKAVVDVCARHLLTPHGLRSLNREHPDYKPHYGGNPYMRDGAYHQGTVWAWLLGPFAIAHHRVYGDGSQARAYLQPLLRHLADHGLGSISEIFDADPPFTPRGCYAQAWSVAEVLRAWHQIDEGEKR